MAVESAMPQFRAGPRWSDVALLFVLYYAGARIGVAWTVMPEGTAILWPPNAVLLSALLRFGGRGYGGIAVAAIGAEVAADWPVFSVAEALSFGLINLAEATLVTVVLLRWSFNPGFAGVADLAKFVVAAPVAGAVAAALPGAWVYTHFRGGETPYLEFVRVWWFGDGLGLMILTPLLLGLWAPRPLAVAAAPVARTRLLGLVLALAAIAALVLASRDGHIAGVHASPVLLLPAVLYVAARFELRVVAAAVAALAAAVVVTTVRQHNPFGAADPQTAVILAQEFIFIVGLMALGLCTLLAQLRARQQQLQQNVDALDELNRSLERRVGERTAELARANAQLEQLARTDPLTGALNRRGLLEAASQEVERCRRYGSGLALIVFDLDHFKAINDRCGHAVGDSVLCQAAAALRPLLRRTDVFARHGGEEFAAIVPEEDATSAAALAERMRSAIAHSRGPAGVPPLTASFGVAVLRLNEEFEALMRRADDALYRAKDGGRNRVSIDPGDADAEAARRSRRAGS